MQRGLFRAPERRPLTAEEKQEKMEEEFVDKNPLLEQIPQDQDRWVSMVDDTPFCKLCNKKGWGHLTSGQHLLRIEDDAIASLMAGPAESTRRFATNHKGFLGAATKKSIMSFWGSALMSLPAEAQARHRQAGTIWLNDKEPIVPEDVEAYVLGVVSYDGQGKYSRDDKKNHFHYFHDLSDSDEVHEGPPLLPPQGQGWWPVIALVLTAAAAARLKWKIPKGGILIICFYQLIAGRLVCWTIIIEI